MVTIKPKEEFQSDTIWEVIRKEYLELNSDPTRTRPVNYVQLAKKHGVNYGSLKVVASHGKWHLQLKAARAARETTQVEVLKQENFFDEIEVRKRQATYARMCMNKGLLYLQQIDVDKLSVRDAIELVKLGMVEERKALGLPDAFTFVPPTQTLNGQFQSVDEHVQQQSRKQALAQQLLSIALMHSAEA